MTVLTISQDTLIQLPDGATGGAVKITYNGTTVGPVIASGDDQGRAVLVQGRLAKLTALDGKTPLKVVGREAGGRLPAWITLSIYPEYPVGVTPPHALVPLTLTGLPVGSPDVPGIWDLSNIGDASGGMDVILPGERQALAVLRERGLQAAERAEGATVAAQAAERAAAETIANLDSRVDSAAQQAAAGTVARVDKALADTAQSAAQAAAAAGLTPTDTYAAIPAAVDGYYRVMSGAEAGQVWQRSGSSLTRRPELEATSQAQFASALTGMTKAQLVAYDRKGSTVAFADGNQWVWVDAAGLTAMGKAWNGGTVLSATGSGGGYWARLYSGPILPRWFDVPEDGVTDAQPALRRLISALRSGDAVDFGSLTYQIKTPDIFVLNKPRIDLIANGAVFNVDPALRRDYWTCLFQPYADDIRLLGKMTIACNVPDSADENQPATGMTGHIQRGVYFGGGKRVILSRVYVTAPLMEGIRVAEQSSAIVLTECDVTHRSGYLDAEKTQIANARTCIAVTNPGYGGADAMAGTNGFIPSQTRDKSITTTINGVTIERCAVRGGTHGYGVFNANNVTLRDCVADDNSHRNVAVGPTSDYVSVLGGTFTKAGSTNIHFANGCRYFLVQGARVDTTLLDSLEGDGIKCYVGCTDGVFANNVVTNAHWNGIRVAFNCQRITVANNNVSIKASRQGTPGTFGIAVLSRTHKQIDSYAQNGWKVTTANTSEIVVSGNTVNGAYSALGLYYEAGVKTSPAAGGSADPGDTAAMLTLSNVTLQGNTAVNCQYAISHVDNRWGGGACSTAYVTNNVLADMGLRNVHNTSYSNGIPSFSYFRSIRNVPHVGTGMGGPSGVKLISKDGDAYKVQWAGAGAPGSSGLYTNGHTYLNESTGELHRYQNGAWAKVTTA